jgi:hypothetical protein
VRYDRAYLWFSSARRRLTTDVRQLLIAANRPPIGIPGLCPSPTTHDAAVRLLNDVLLTFHPACGGPQVDPLLPSSWEELESRLVCEHAEAKRMSQKTDHPPSDAVQRDSDETAATTANTGRATRSESLGAAGNRAMVHFYLLTSWAEIFDAINDTHPERPWANNDSTRAKIRGLNNDFTGPIRMPDGKGKQPEVEKTELLLWWADMASKYSATSEESERDADSKRATVAVNHPHGKGGVVMPDIGGSVRKSKRKGKV